MSLSKKRSLADRCPKLVKEWHPYMNGDLIPEEISASSHEKVWWILPYDDPETGKHWDFVWSASVYNRVKGNKCPFLSGKAVWKGYNDLATKNPELAAQWHPTKNGTLLPEDVTIGYRNPVWWLLPYDDPETGKHYDFEWPATIADRNRGRGCPFLSGNAVWPGYNDLATTHPELANEWHLSKNGEITPYNISHGSGYKAIWVKRYKDPRTGKLFTFEWKQAVFHRSSREDCPFLKGKAVFKGFNDLAAMYPELASEFHPARNGKLTADLIYAHSTKKVWWVKKYDDPRTGKQFLFEWEDSVYNRSKKGAGCPYLTGKKVYKGFNDLATICQELADQVDVEANGNKAADSILANSNAKIFWKYHYEVPETGEHIVFKWDASPAMRIREKGVPFLNNQRVWPGFNDLKTKYPRIASEWDYERNKKRPENYMPNSRDEVAWRYDYDDTVTGKHFVFRWKARITNRVQDDGKCPFLSGNAVWKGYNDFASNRPYLASEWDNLKNRNLTPDMVTLYSNKKRWWVCPDCGKSWYASPSKRAVGYGHGCY